MVDSSYYLDTDLKERQELAKRRLYDYFQVKEGDKQFRWTFSNWEEAEKRNRKELPYQLMPVEYLDELACGWKSFAHREVFHRQLKEANPSDICISTNHLLMITSIVDDATSAEILNDC